MGDVYTALVNIDAVCTKMDAIKNEILWAFDSVYLQHDPRYKWHEEALYSLLDHAGIPKISRVPKDKSSADDLFCHTTRQRRQFFNNWEMSFMRGCHTETIKLVRRVASHEKRYVVATLMPEQTYMWVPEDDMGQRIQCDVTKTRPVDYILGYTKHYRVCLHPRNKYGLEYLAHYQKIAQRCKDKNIPTVIIGDADEGEMPSGGSVEDLRSKMSFDYMMATSADADLFIGSNSVFTYHRMYSGGLPCWIYSPYSIGEPSSITQPLHLGHRCHHFINTESPEMVEQSLTGIYEAL